MDRKNLNLKSPLQHQKPSEKTTLADTFYAVDTHECSSSIKYGLQSRLDELDDRDGADDYRDYRDREVRRCRYNLLGPQCDSQWSYWGDWNNLFDEHRSRKLATGDYYSGCWNYRDSGHRKDRRNHQHHHKPFRLQPVKILLAISLLCGPVRAESEGTTTVVASPQASSSGAVTNSAVQINQGSYSTQGFGAGHYCNSGTVVFSPFYLGGDVHSTKYTRNQNFGAQISFSVPLDGSITELCKEVAKKNIQKTRVDILLTRMRECTKLYEAGYMIRPSSPYAKICDDVVPIAAYSKSGQPSQDGLEPVSRPE